MIRKATKKDASRIAEILVFAKRKAYRSIFNNDQFSFNELQVLEVALNFQNNLDSLKNILVYDDEGIVKGMMNRGKMRNKDGIDDLEVYELYIEPFFQGEGIGSKLMKEVISEAHDEQVNRIILWVLEENKCARKFYESFGFVPNGIKQTVEGTNTVEIQYLKQFTQDSL